MNGILLIDKPKNWTSFDVVAKIRGLAKKETGQRKLKVGHAGTLDPLATGLLIVLVGEATKKQDELMKQDKTYRVTLKLGQISSTGDEEGVKSVVSSKKPSLSDIEAVMTTFVGEQYQIPPKFSAIKVNGQRAYKLAREGKNVKLEPRKITVHSITDLVYQYPIINFECKVSSGTYIRSLITDIGDKLTTGAYMTELRRTIIGDYSISSAKKIEDMNLFSFLRV